MTKRIDAKTVFMILMCVLVLIACLFPFWGISLNGLALTTSTISQGSDQNAYTEIFRCKIFGLKNINFYNRYTDPDTQAVVGNQNAYDLLKSFIPAKDVYGDRHGIGIKGIYLYLAMISEILSVAIVVFCAIRLIMYVLQICGVKLPVKIEKILCPIILGFTMLLLVLVLVIEFTLEMPDGTFSPMKENPYVLKYLFTDMGFYLIVVPAFIIGLKGKAPKPKKKD